MNEEIFNMWLNSNKISIDPLEFNILIKWMKYFDKHSLRLNNYYKNNDEFEFTNDAQIILIKKQDGLSYIKNMEKGIAFPWSQFEKK